MHYSHSLSRLHPLYQHETNALGLVMTGLAPPHASRSAPRSAPMRSVDAPHVDATNPRVKLASRYRRQLDEDREMDGQRRSSITSCHGHKTIREAAWQI